MRRHGETAGCVSNVNQLCGEKKKSASDAFQCPEKKLILGETVCVFPRQRFVGAWHVPG